MRTKEDEISLFQSIPWISNLLRDDSFETIATPSRQPKPTTEDSFFSNTLNSPTTISACLTQYRKPQSPQSSSTANVEELRTFCTLGQDVNGYPGTLHGGVVAALLDETMGLLIMIRGEGGDASTRDSNLSQTPVTAYLNIRFLRPIATPGTIVVSAQLKEAIEDRKWTIEAAIRDEKGRTLATGECLFVRIRSRL
ncbi:hypothetical protein MPDQ_004684 [Monascus purpureus]|uniref:Thioesterase domain-containing protein n=1 Tax=Monascus purpureus TaxID=5098 RepID=A0A507QXJ8_MONPU|nr:hypothetical protein MPDQ_004684 [Monascus purpureus]BDD60782.1 hypothetical protein MAP00_005881 [Monascus purpureus]